MRHPCQFTWGIALALTSAAAGPGTEPAPADFKLTVELHDETEQPIDKGELVVRRGRLYQFRMASSEVVIIDPEAEKVDLLDLKRKVQTSVTFRGLDEGLARLRKELTGSVERFEKKDDRASRLTARMTRDLIEPKLSASFDASAHRLRLTGDRVDVEATGVPEPDAGRRALIAAILPALAKLESMRDPEFIPPFTRLETLAAVGDRQLLPTELSFLYRLMGKPLRLRWTYRLVPELTDREREALALIENLRPRSKSLLFESYERSNPERTKARTNPLR